MNDKAKADEDARKRLDAEAARWRERFNANARGLMESRPSDKPADKKERE